MLDFDDSPQRIISDFTKLDFDYVPDELVHREGQMKQLFSLFRPAVETDRNQRAFLYGGVGTGKTVLSKRFCLDLKEWAKSKGKRVEFVMVNCRF